MMKKKITIMAMVLLLFTLVLGGCSQQAMLEAQNPATISVSANSFMDVLPDQAEIYVSIASRGETEQVQKDNAALSDKVIEAIVDAGVDKTDIETVSIDFRPNYVYNKETYKSEIDGYEAIHRLKITIMDLELVGQVIDDAVVAGAEMIDNVSFTISDDKKEEYKNALIEEAVASTRTKADAAAAASGESIDGIQTLNVSDDNGTPYYRADYMMEADVASDESYEILPGEVRVNVSVQASYRLK
ncbi:SIMPL domain-containing protein [Clostridia bacterium]|nr:SIMPL domain-containing protein [Clostridia bacterium]